MIETFKIISGYYNVNAEVFFEFDEGGKEAIPGNCLSIDHG